MSNKKTTTRDTFNDAESIASQLSADSVTLQAGNDLNIRGSNVVATHDVDLNVSGNVNIVAVQDTDEETHIKQVKQSGFSATSSSVSYGSSKLTNTNDSQQVTQYRQQQGDQRNQRRTVTMGSGDPLDML